MYTDSEQEFKETHLGPLKGIGGSGRSTSTSTITPDKPDAPMNDEKLSTTSSNDIGIKSLKQGKAKTDRYQLRPKP